MAETGRTALYDIERALVDLRAVRAQGGLLVVESERLAEKVSRHWARHFSTSFERETAGRAVVLGAATVHELTSKGVELPSALNIAAFAGEFLVRRACGGG